MAGLCSTPPSSSSLLKSRGVVETHNCNIPSQASTPSPPPALLRMRGGQLTYVSLFQPSARHLEIHVQYFTAPLFVRTLLRRYASTTVSPRG
jgi:hypothetical protein